MGGGRSGPRAHRLGVALVGGALLVGCTGSVESASATRAITNGTDTAGDPAVVAIIDAPLGCTGTLIDPIVVITSAHCRVQDDPTAVRVSFGSLVGGDAITVPLLDAVAHPLADETADHDLALLLLAEPAPVPFVPLDVEPSLAAAPPVPVRLVGFGVTDPAAGDDGRKREGWSETVEVTPWHVVLGAAPSLPCNGDSGGPALVTTDAGERVAAVVSRGDAGCGEQAKATRIDAHLDGFIRPQIDAWAAGEIPGELGAACEANEDCRSRDCVEGEGLCSTRCVSGRGDCPSGFGCEHLGGVEYYCLPEGGSGRCSASRTPHASAPGWLLLPPLLLLLALRRR